MNIPVGICTEFASLIGLPKIALRKSGTKTIEKFAGCGWIKFFSRYVIPKDSYWGSRLTYKIFNQIFGQLCPEPGRRVASLYQDKEVRKII
jgi:hypothetical protein